MKPDKATGWFFLDEVLHRAVAINRFENYVKAFDYEADRIKMYKWDELIRNKEYAHTLSEVGALINRRPRTMRFYIHNGIAEPTGIAQRGNRLPKYFFNARNIMLIRDAVEEYASGAPYSPVPVPTREQLRTMLSAGGVLYVKEGDDFVPVWQAKF